MKKNKRNSESSSSTKKKSGNDNQTLSDILDNINCHLDKLNEILDKYKNAKN